MFIDYTSHPLKEYSLDKIVYNYVCDKCQLIYFYSNYDDISREVINIAKIIPDDIEQIKIMNLPISAIEILNFLPTNIENITVSMKLNENLCTSYVKKALSKISNLPFSLKEINITFMNYPFTKNEFIEQDFLKIPHGCKVNIEHITNTYEWETDDQKTYNCSCCFFHECLLDDFY